MCTSASAQQRDSWDCCAYPVLRSNRTTVFPSSHFWGINASLEYGDGKGRSTSLNATAGVVDTGTTLLGLAAGQLLRDSDSYSMGELRYIVLR